MKSLWNLFISMDMHPTARMIEILRQFCWQCVSPGAVKTVGESNFGHETAYLKAGNVYLLAYARHLSGWA